MNYHEPRVKHDLANTPRPIGVNAAPWKLSGQQVALINCAFELAKAEVAARKRRRLNPRFSSPWTMN